MYKENLCLSCIIYIHVCAQSIRLESALEDPLVGEFQVMLLQQENTFNTIVTYTVSDILTAELLDL